MAIIIHIVLVSFNFLTINECLMVIKYLGKFAASIALLSLFIGWLAFQIFEELYLPHYRTRSFKLIKKHFDDIDYKISDECCFAIGDYLLKDDMYIKYPGLADTFRGYWDHYYSRRIIGLSIPLVSALMFSLLLYLEGSNADIGFDIVCPCGDAWRFTYLSLLLIYNTSIYVALWVKSDRISKEVECQEFLLILDNINRLNDEKFNPFIKNDLDSQDHS